MKIIQDGRCVYLRRSDKYIWLFLSVFVNQLLSWLVAVHYSNKFSYLYIDPGSGILLWQLLVATLVGFVFSVRSRLARFVKKLSFGRRD
jgi:hypothetical protein